MQSKLAYTAEKSLLATLVVVLGFVGSMLGDWWKSRDVVPPMPVVTVELSDLPDSRVFVTRNGKTLPDSEAKPIKDAARKGDGDYRITGYPDNAEPISKTVLIGDVKPDVVPVPPKPVDPPKPPDPPKPVDPAPIPVAGFRVLIVEETQDRAKLPVSQLSILTATNAGSVREYLNRMCAKDSDGKTPAFKIIDKDQTGELLEPVWADAMKLNRDSVPWIVVSNGVTGYSGPLPKTEAETLTLLKKYGGE